MIMSEFVRIGCLCLLTASCARIVSPDAPATASSELTLEVTTSLRGSRTATLRSGDDVMSGDGIQIAVKPTVDAQLYVAYCDRNGQLTLFPRDDGIKAKAGKVTYAPSKDASIILDDQVGPEVLYVIASHRPLDVADPELTAAISRARSDAHVECGAPLDRVLQGNSVVMDAGATRQQDVHAEQVTSPGATTSQNPPPGSPPRGGTSMSPTSPPTARPPHTRPPPRIPPPADLQRGAFIRWGSTGAVSAGADRSDIVVLRYNFTHVASRASAR